MQVSKRKINKQIENQIYQILYQLVADLKTPKEAQVFLEDVLSDAERSALAKRIAVAQYLTMDRSYENIKENLKVSSATIASVEKAMRKNSGYALALKKIDADRWAGEWAGKIEKFFKRI